MIYCNRKERDVIWKKQWVIILQNRQKTIHLLKLHFFLGGGVHQQSRRNLLFFGWIWHIHCIVKDVVSWQFTSFWIGTWLRKIHSSFFWGAHSDLRIDWLQTCNALLLVIYTVECACRLYVERGAYVSRPSLLVAGIRATAGRSEKAQKNRVMTVNLWPTKPPESFLVRNFVQTKMLERPSIAYFLICVASCLWNLVGLDGWSWRSWKQVHLESLKAFKCARV